MLNAQCSNVHGWGINKECGSHADSEVQFSVSSCDNHTPITHYSMDKPKRKSKSVNENVLAEGR